MKFLYNELEYAKYVEKNGFTSKNYYTEMVLLVKYWKSIGNKPKERKEKLYKFCENNITGFNRVLYFKIINSALKSGSRKDNSLIVIEQIPVTISEITYVNNLDIDYNYKKVLFTLLVNNKIKKEICKLRFGQVSEFNYVGGKKKYYNDIIEMAKIEKSYKVNNIINWLSDNGFIDVRTKAKVNLIFINNIPEDDNVAFSITTFDNIGYYFDWYNQDNKIIKCENCGKLVKATNNRKKYCKECWKEKHKEQDRNYQKKKYYSRLLETPL